MRAAKPVWAPINRPVGPWPVGNQPMSTNRGWGYWGQQGFGCLSTKPIGPEEATRDNKTS